jgi:hypothetical protein
LLAEALAKWESGAGVPQHVVQGRQARNEVVLLVDEPERLAGQAQFPGLEPSQIGAVDLYPAVLGEHDRTGAAKQRCLARPAGAEYGHHLARMDV